MANLFELAQPINELKVNLDNLVESGEIGTEEALEIFRDNLEALQMPIKEKIESLVNWQQDNQFDIDTLKAQKKKIDEMFDKKIEQLDKKIKWTKEYILNGMLLSGIDKIETDLFKAKVTQTQSCKVVDEEKLKRYVVENGLEDSYIRRKITEEWNIVEMKKAIKNGATIDGVVIETKDSIRIS